MLYLLLRLRIIFLFLYHPLSIGLILFLQTISICFIYLRFWFSYVLLLINLEGILVLFICYQISLKRNIFYSNKILFTTKFY